jgi:ketosteroid isomerase-like protein
MAEENAEIVRRAIESFAIDAEAWIGTLDPAIRWYPEEEGQALVFGHQGVLRSRERWLETFQQGTLRVEIEELRGQAENVMSAVRERGHGRASGIEIDGRTYSHWKLRNGKVVYVYEHTTREEALEAAGLSE